MALASIQAPSPGSVEQAVAKALAQGVGKENAVSDGEAFRAVFLEAVDRVENYRRTAEQTVHRFLSGEEEEVHKVAMAAQQAELSFELFLQVKNKVVQAYQEIMRMQL